jgi:hypothetical protein
MIMLDKNAQPRFTGIFIFFLFLSLIEETAMFKGGTKAAKSATGKTASTKGGRADDESILRLFTSLADEDDPEWISLEGVGKLADALGVDPMV